MVHIPSLSKPKKRAVAGVCFLLLPLISLFASQTYVLADNPPPSKAHPFTSEEAVQIQRGEIRMKPQTPEQDDWVDASLINSAVMLPEADDDGDGIPNAQELQVYTENGSAYLLYNSHPKLADTDGDGISDSQDSHPLSWDVSARDGIFFQELSYRDDDYIRAVLASTDPDTPLELKDGNEQYRRMQRELAPYWILKDSWHMDNGLHAALFAFSNHNYPYLEDASAHMLAFRGTNDARQFITDFGILMGIFPQAARDTQLLADHIAYKGYKNVSVCGHSLGGYLAQIFMARSLGQEFGQGKYHNGTDYNREDSLKKFNPEIQHEFTFNALRILSRKYSGVALEYYHVSKAIDENYSVRPEHYSVSNDNVIGHRHPDNNILIGDSAHQHRSASFFEDRFQQTVPTFVSGWRKGMAPDPGIQNPGLDRVFFTKPTILELQDESGAPVFTRVFAVRESDVANRKVNLRQFIPPAYEVVGTPSLQPGTKNVIRVQKKPIFVAYRFVDESGAEIKTITIQTTYQMPYSLPELPVHSDPNKSYVCANGTSLPQIPSEELTENRMLTVPLQTVDKQVQTRIELYDQTDKGQPSAVPLKVLQYETPRREQEQTTFTLHEQDLPEGYLLPDPNPIFTAGETHRVYLDRKTFTVDFEYIDGEVLLHKDTLQVAYGNTPDYTLQLPDGYELKKGFVFELPSNITASQNIRIPVERKIPDSKTIRALVQLQDKILSESASTIQRADVQNGAATIKLTLPAHPRAKQDWEYFWEDPSFDGTHTLTQEEWDSGADLHFSVYERQNPHQVSWAIYDVQNPDTPVLAQGTTSVQPGRALEIPLPESPNALYSWIDPLPIPETSYSSDQPLRLFVRKETRLYPVQILYHSSDPEYFWESEEENRLLEYEEEYALDPQRRFFRNEEEKQYGIYYSIKEPAPAILVNKQTDLAQKPIRFQVELQRQVPQYQVELLYRDQDTKAIVNQETVTLAAGSSPQIELPPLPAPTQDGDYDGYYVLSDTFHPTRIAKDQTLEIPIKRQLNQYPVLLRFIDEKGTELLLYPEDVVSGERPVLPTLPKDLEEYQIQDPNRDLPIINWKNAKKDEPIVLDVVVVRKQGTSSGETIHPRPDQPNLPSSPQSDSDSYFEKLLPNPSTASSDLNRPLSTEMPRSKTPAQSPQSPLPQTGENTLARFAGLLFIHLALLLFLFLERKLRSLSIHS